MYSRIVCAREIARAWTAIFAIGLVPLPLSAQTSTYVIHISVDGLRSDAIGASIASGDCPNFIRLRNQGAFTDNARTDFDYTITLPNHTSQLTGRPVLGPAGHGWVSNSDPAPGETLHSNKGSYVAGIFDVAHDNGLRTALFAGKSKFSLYQASWGQAGGAPDAVGPVDNGNNKIDTYTYNADSSQLVSSFVSAMTAAPFDYSFIHLRDPDSAGHASGWNVTDRNSPYMNAVRAVDGYVGALLAMIDNDPRFAVHTTLLLTADHGGPTGQLDHSNALDPQDYTIPFYSWGAGVTHADLYALNVATRLDPSTTRPDFTAALQPIRNGDIANLALQLLGLGPVPGSEINRFQDLSVPEPAGTLTAAVCFLLVRRRRVLR